MNLGDTIEYTLGVGPSRSCLVWGVRRSGSTIERGDGSGTFPGIQFLLRPRDGGRAFWTPTFAEEHPIDLGGGIWARPDEA